MLGKDNTGNNNLISEPSSQRDLADNPDIEKHSKFHLFCV